MLSGFTRDQGRYFVKPSPAKKGIEKNSFGLGIILSLKEDNLENLSFLSYRRLYRSLC